MRSLSRQIAVGFIAVAVACVGAAALTARLTGPDPSRWPPPRQSVALAELVVADLPADPSAKGAALSARAAELQVSLSLWDAGGRLLHSSGGAPAAPDVADPDPVQWVGRGALAIHLGDERWLGVSLPGDHTTGMFQHFFAVLGVLLLTIVVGSHPLARRITRRLEALQAGVERFGGGALGARVSVRGGDEVAALARAFNRAAERIEALVLGQRRVLASASHELRSPLARLRMALELLLDGDPEPAARAALLADATRDVAELDALIEDLLLASRLDTVLGPPRTEAVELLALAAEEAVRTGATVEGEPTFLEGDPRLLRRLLRNLLENAARHGGGAAEVSVRSTELVVADRGPGVPEAERERIFEPFYRPAGHKEGDGGVGLGLALVRQIAHHHGATVRVEAREGGGSRFILRFGGG